MAKILRKSTKRNIFKWYFALEMTKLVFHKLFFFTTCLFQTDFKTARPTYF